MSRNIIWATALVLIAILPYYGIWGFEFISFDDPEYITENQQVMTGLTWESIKWAFTTNAVANWHPLTWMSHMLDVSLFGMNPGAHHVGNVVLHALNTVLLFGFMARASGCAGRSAIVAALFAVHPLHVESVAWISERKDVLSTFFMLLTLWAYLAYTKRPNGWRYLVVFVLLAMGLMSKPMLVTLPFVLLLMDAWPLNRLSLKPFDRAAAIQLIREKLPLFGLVAVSGVITFLVQQDYGAMSSVDKVPLTLRLANALTSYIEYVINMFVPTRLAVLYPLAPSIPIWKPLGSAALISAVTVLAIKSRAKLPYVSVGWFWFLGTLVPVIGIVQVGSQAMADRYTYIPLIGLFIIVVWGCYDLLGHHAAKKAPLVASALLVIAGLTSVSWMQARYWQNSTTLWTRTLEVTENNHRAHNKLAIQLADSGQSEKAIAHYKMAIKIQPGFARAHNNLGNVIAAAGHPKEALQHFENALAAKPDYAMAFNGIGSALDDLGRTNEAIASYENAVKIDPTLSAVHNNLAAAYYKQGKLDQAVEKSRLALELEPQNASYQINYAILMFSKGDIESARQHIEIALRLRPGDQQAIKVMNMLPAAGTNKAH